MGTKVMNHHSTCFDSENCFRATDGVTAGTSSSTVTLTVPKTASILVVKNRAGSSNAVDVSVSGITGSYRLTAGEREELPVAGYSDGAEYPTTVTLTLGATTNVDFYFKCRTAAGA